MTVTIFPHRNDLYAALFPKSGVIAEVGVFRGENAAAIAAAAQPRELHLIDLWDYRFCAEYQSACRIDERLSREALPADTQGQGPLDEPAWRGIREAVFSTFAGRPNVTLHAGVSWQVGARFPDGYFDAVYIDGDHRRECCAADLDAYAPKVAPSGILAGHDFCFDFPGVIASVVDFLQQHPDWRMVAIGAGRFTSYALQRA